MAQDTLTYQGVLYDPALMSASASLAGSFFDMDALNSQVASRSLTTPREFIENVLTGFDTSRMLTSIAECLEANAAFSGVAQRTLSEWDLAGVDPALMSASASLAGSFFDMDALDSQVASRSLTTPRELIENVLTGFDTSRIAASVRDCLGEDVFSGLAQRTVPDAASLGFGPATIASAMREAFNMTVLAGPDASMIDQLSSVAERLVPQFPLSGERALSVRALADAAVTAPAVLRPRLLQESPAVMDTELGEVAGDLTRANQPESDEMAALLRDIYAFLRNAELRQSNSDRVSWALLVVSLGILLTALVALYYEVHPSH